MTRAEEILHYWFGELDEASMPSTERNATWFAKNPEVDAEINAKFKDDIQKAANGTYLEWEQTSHPRLALILLLDQFTRNIYRDDPQAYQYDQKALDLCITGIQSQLDHELSLIERVFFYMPLQHSEELKMQHISLQMYQSLMDLALPETKAMFANTREFAIRHYEIIKRFGRFPHRNAILGRDSTPEELTFLQQQGSSF